MTSVRNKNYLENVGTQIYWAYENEENFEKILLSLLNAYDKELAIKRRQHDKAK